jgi:hypothetical protein
MASPGNLKQARGSIEVRAHDPANFEVRAHDPAN